MICHARFLVWLALACAAACADAPPPGPPTVLSGAESEALVDARVGPRAPSPPPDAGALPASASERLTIGARAIDERYRPLALAELAWIETGEDGTRRAGARAAADRNGTVWLVLERERLPAEGELLLELSAPGHVTQTFNLQRARWVEDVCLLGELTLTPELGR